LYMHTNMDPQAPFDETAHALFKRGTVKPIATGLKLFDKDLPGGLKYGDVVEVYGQANVGKTEVILQILVNCILPKRWNGTDINGNESGVVYFDNDLHLSMPRLLAVMESRIRSSARNNRALTTDDIQQIALSSLHRLHIFNCKDLLQFLATLESLPILLESENNIKLLVVDSISCFYWPMRNEEREGPQLMKQIAAVLKRLLNSHSLLLFATKGTISQPEKYGQDADGSIIHKSYLFNWDTLVKYRLILSHTHIQSKDKLTQFLAKLASPLSTPTTNNTNDNNNNTSNSATSTFIYKYIIDNTGVVFL